MRGQMSAIDAVPQTRFCAPQERDEIVGSVEKWRERMKNDVDGAQKQLGKIVVSPQLVESGRIREEPVKSGPDTLAAKLGRQRAFQGAVSRNLAAC